MTENYSKRSYSDAIIGAPYNPYNPVYFLPHKVSIASVAPVVMNPYVTSATYGSVIGPRNNMLSHPTDTVRDNLVGAKLLPKIRSRSNLLRRVSNALVGIVKEPENESVLGTFLNNIIKQDPTAYSPEYNNNKNVIDKNNVVSRLYTYFIYNHKIQLLIQNIDCFRETKLNKTILLSVLLMKLEKLLQQIL